MERVYCAVSGKPELLEGDSLFSYGICVRLNNADFHTFDNISVNREKVEKLIGFIERNEIAFSHIPDIIEDFLTD